METAIRKNIGWRLFVQTILGRAYPRVVGMSREKSWLFFEIFLPMLSVSAYVFVYRALKAPEEYIGFVVVGGAMTAFWMNILWSMSSQLYWEKETGNLALYIMSPANLMGILLGMALGGMVSTAQRALGIILLGSLAFKVQYAVGDFWQLLLVFFLAMTALYGMGMMFASLYLLWGREAWNLSALMEEPVFFSSGFYFPQAGLYQVGGWARAVAIAGTFIPATLGLDAMRQLVLGPTAFGGQLWILGVGQELALLAVFAVVFLILARYALAYLEMLAKREGKLTSRHQ